MGARSLSGMVENTARPSSSAADETAKAEYWEIVRSALSPRLYRVVCMYFRERLTQEDIAERIGVSQPRAFELIEQALERLRKPGIAELLESAIPAGRKPPALDHTALHAYQVAQAYGESWEDRDFLAEQDREIWEERMELAGWRREMGAYPWANNDHWIEREV